MIKKDPRPVQGIQGLPDALGASLRMLLVSVFFFAGATQAMSAAPTAGTEPAKPNYGLKVYKSANCMGCHKWHGGGGPGYGGLALSLRTTELNREQLIEVIKCGRPATNMPFHDRKAYKDDRCYGLTLSDFEGDDENRPLQAPKFINDRQTGLVADFVLKYLKGQELTKEYCELFFGVGKTQCERME